ncbi:hypothetical protein T265_13099, partial [Opisthorchis viverrini]
LEHRRDFLLVYDGQINSNLLLGKWTGDQLPPSIVSTGNNLRLELTTNGALRRKGFLAEYRSLPSIGEGTMRTNCTTSFASPANSIASPNYPRSYQANLNYTWTISQPEGCVVRLQFEDFELESDSDFVHVYDGPASHENLLDTWTGTCLPSPRISTRNSMTVAMRTDSSLEFRGFYATYDT